MHVPPHLVTVLAILQEDGFNAVSEGRCGFLDRATEVKHGSTIFVRGVLPGVGE